MSTATNSLADCCKSPAVTDLTQGYGVGRHYYCKKCKSHEYNGVQYTAREWDLWISSEIEEAA